MMLAMMRFLTLFAILAISIAAPASAQKREVPYWASIRAEKVNMRVGPGGDYPIEWVYKRQGLPVKVIRVHEGYRLVRDPDGAEGWIVARLLSPERGALVIGEGLAEMRNAPGSGGRVKWRLEPGAVGALGNCDEGWCELTVRGHYGWVEASRLWGAGDP